ncbi:hypothetical protein P4O66_000262 [Electrophorus voltai]|uniref:Secreted protein n=1 Tax=Electrophorus voltai TaxID=2609070 RepID=A0AAD8ZIR3_9TELE|nr:hypothetical protein P4O66_000262 [Electrophorus voltai]
MTEVCMLVLDFFMVAGTMLSLKKGTMNLRGKRVKLSAAAGGGAEAPYIAPHVSSTLISTDGNTDDKRIQKTEEAERSVSAAVVAPGNTGFDAVRSSATFFVLRTSLPSTSLPSTSLIRFSGRLFCCH